MIIGIGIDLLKIERVKRLSEKESFLKKCFTPTEIEKYRSRPAVLAGNFSVKEAVAKAFGTGFVGFNAADIECLRDKDGKPYVRLTGGALKKADELGVIKLYVSISDTDELVAAFCVAEGGESI